MKTNTKKPKKIWTKPQLIVHGDVKQLTAAKGKNAKWLGTHDGQNLHPPDSVLS
jgi:hypothetical protein